MTLRRTPFSQVLIAISSQAISSITNFAFTLSLVGSLAPDAFGLYSFTFAFVLAGGAILQGFFQLQMVTELPQLKKSEHSTFAANIFVSQIVVGFGLMFVLIVLTVLFSASSNQLVTATITGLAILGLASKEMLIRYLFAVNQKTPWIPAINLVLAAVISVLVAIDFAAQSAITAMASYASAHIVAATFGLLIAPLSFRLLRIPSTVRFIAKNGAWAATSALIYSLRANAHTFLVAGYLPLAEVGRMNAARTMVTPATLLIPTLSSITLPRMSQAFATQGRLGVQRLTQFIGVILVSAVLIYAGFLLLAWPSVKSYILGENFFDIGSYVALWVIYAVTIGVRNVLEWAIQSMKEFLDLTKVNAIGSFTTLVLVAILVQTLGVSGAILGLIAGEVLMSSLLVARIFHKQ